MYTVFIQKALKHSLTWTFPRNLPVFLNSFLTHFTHFSTTIPHHKNRGGTVYISSYTQRLLLRLLTYI